MLDRICPLWPAQGRYDLVLVGLAPTIVVSAGLSHTIGPLLTRAQIDLVIVKVAFEAALLRLHCI